MEYKLPKQKSYLNLGYEGNKPLEKQRYSYLPREKYKPYKESEAFKPYYKEKEIYKEPYKYNEPTYKYGEKYNYKEKVPKYGYKYGYKTTRVPTTTTKIKQPWGKIKQQKISRRKTHYYLAYSPDFTSKAFGIEMKGGRKLARRALTTEFSGFETRPMLVLPKGLFK